MGLGGGGVGRVRGEDSLVCGHGSEVVGNISIDVTVSVFGIQVITLSYCRSACPHLFVSKVVRLKYCVQCHLIVCNE